jgi:hypothetical protein
MCRLLVIAGESKSASGVVPMSITPSPLGGQSTSRRGVRVCCCVDAPVIEIANSSSLHDVYIVI